MEQIVVRDGGQAMQQGGSDIEQTRLAYTSRIRKLVRMTAQHIVEIGEMLHWGYTNLNTTSFDRWVRGDLGWTMSQAHQYIRVYHRFGDIDLSGTSADPQALFLLSRFQLGSDPVQNARTILQSGEPLLISDAYALEQQNPSAELDSKLASLRERNKVLNAKRQREDAKPDSTPATPQARRIVRHEIPVTELWQAMQHLQVMLVECYHTPLRSPVARALANFQRLLPPISLDTIDIAVVETEAAEDV